MGVAVVELGMHNAYCITGNADAAGPEAAAACDMERKIPMTDSEIQRLADEAAIRRVLDEYCLRLEINPFEDWLDLFTEDTVYEVYRKSLRGRAEVAAMLSQAPHGLHIPGATRVDLQGDRAETVQSYLFVPTSNDRWNAGWYLRTLVRTEQGWKIARTVVKFGRYGELAADEKAHALPFPVSFG